MTVEIMMYWIYLIQQVNSEPVSLQDYNIINITQFFYSTVNRPAVIPSDFKTTHDKFNLLLFIIEHPD